MALRNLRLDGDELLRKKSKPVKTINNNILTLLDDMVETMRSHEGLGLAAPQVGVLKRIVVIEVGDTLYELINPQVVETEGIQTKDEGCLSIPGKVGTVDRPAMIKIKALNRNGNEIFLEGEETLAIAFCHELDHLDGILYKDKALEGTFRDIEIEESTDEDDEA